MSGMSDLVPKDPGPRTPLQLLTMVPDLCLDCMSMPPMATRTRPSQGIAPNKDRQLLAVLLVIRKLDRELPWPRALLAFTRAAELQGDPKYTMSK